MRNSVEENTRLLGTHVGGPFAKGTLEGYEVECPWHGSKFDVRTGEPTRSPATRAEPTYEIKVVC